MNLYWDVLETKIQALVVYPLALLEILKISLSITTWISLQFRKPWYEKSSVIEMSGKKISF